jgi:hypothetical protein
MSEDLLFHMADKACVRAWEDEGWGPYHKKLLTMCLKVENNGWKVKNGMTQNQKILEHMRKNGSITQREAYIDYGVQSFHRRLTELKDAGHKIKKVGKIHPTTGQNYSRYYLEETTAKGSRNAKA